MRFQELSYYLAGETFLGHSFSGLIYYDNQKYVCVDFVVRACLRIIRIVSLVSAIRIHFRDARYLAIIFNSLFVTIMCDEH